MRIKKQRCLALLMMLMMLIFTLYGCSAKSEDATTNDQSNKAADSSVTNDDADKTDTKDTDKADTDTAATQEPITITFWHTYGDSEEAAFLEKVIPLWNEKYPNITVEAVRQDSGNYHQMIVTGFGTGDLPDVARIDIVNTASYAAQGGLVALDSFEDFSSISEQCLAGPLSTNFYKDHYYGLPLDTNCKAAVVNMNKLTEIGLSEVPATMEEFIQAAEGYGNYLLNVSGVGTWDLYPYFWLFGGTLTNDTYTQATGYLNSEASINAINKLLDLNAKKVFTIRDVDGTVDAWDGISSGEYAMFFEGPWYFSSYSDREAAGILPATVPTYEGRSASVVGGENIGVFSTGKNQEAAYLFAKFMVSEEAQLAMLQVGQLPILSSLVNNDTVTSNPVWSVYMKQMESAMARIPSPNNSTIDQIWSDTMTNIFAGGADVKEELDKAASLMDEQLQ